MDIAPGTTVRIEVAAVPRTDAAAKTLARICSKDPAVARQMRWRKQHRPSLQTWRRGGRMWEHRMKSRPTLVLEPGRQYTVFASVDVLRDLGSVARWVKVTPA